MRNISRLRPLQAGFFSSRDRSPANLFRCNSIASTYPGKLVGRSNFQIFTLFIFLDSPRAFLDHGILYVFWKVQQKPFHLTEKVSTYLLTCLPNYLPPFDTYLRCDIWETCDLSDIQSNTYPPNYTYPNTHLPTDLLREHPYEAIPDTFVVHFYTAAPNYSGAKLFTIQYVADRPPTWAVLNKTYFY